MSDLLCFHKNNNRRIDRIILILLFKCNRYLCIFYGRNEALWSNSNEKNSMVPKFLVEESIMKENLKKEGKLF